MRRIPRGLASTLAIAAVAAPLWAHAQPAPSGYVPPKLVKPGKSTTPLGGPGKVIVKVLVYANATFKVIEVLKSTNHADDAAALEIARTGTYKPALKAGKPQTAFYDYELSFTASGASAGQSSANTPLDEAERQLRTNNFSGAETALTGYIAAHPGDQRAETDLGVAYAFSGDPTQAVAAFDKGGPVPDNYKVVAGKAYADYAIVEYKAKDNDLALAAAKKAVALAPALGTYNTLGLAESATGDFTAAAADLEKARALGASTNAGVKDRAQVDINLVSTYLAAGNVDMAKTVAAEVAQLDPTQAASAQSFIANYLVKQAQGQETKSGTADAAGTLEAATQSLPTQAVMLWSQAAILYLEVKPTPDNAKAKADADKALAIDPNSALGNYAAGIALARQGSRKEALVFLGKADAAAKTSGDTRVATLSEAAIATISGAK
jgi:tetratricopeptide (TPR) repeat protein